jgi:hypothetical protein
MPQAERYFPTTTRVPIHPEAHPSSPPSVPCGAPTQGAGKPERLFLWGLVFWHLPPDVLEKEVVALLEHLLLLFPLLRRARS